jgi:hypothetical protein
VKAIRIAQVVAFVVLALYLWVVHSMNDQVVTLPLLWSLRPGWLVLVTIAVTALLAWLPARTRLWRLERQLRRTTEERDALRARLSPRAVGNASEPVIPDRIDPYTTLSGNERRGEDPSDYL